ncbi:hypothetical protein LEP1GSC161_0266 [Leptospira santarosai str. CBC1416]|uniref:Uncharacterized protein n=1 Tax=Leptospira santarosai str. CBC1416 TaxID=1193059 RepID=M6W5L9_9LEPT|nr:hypothetical protein LEP1GSC161_0266 [Leptospira santarosai str. CBC1416]
MESGIYGLMLFLTIGLLFFLGKFCGRATWSIGPVRIYLHFETGFSNWG